MPTAAAGSAGAPGGAAGRPGRPGPAVGPVVQRPPTMKITVPAPPPRIRSGPPTLEELIEIISPLDPTELYKDLNRIGSGYVEQS